MGRLSRTEYYFKVVEAVALRGTCDRGRSGAIIVRDGRILTAGYVGAPKGIKHCDEVDHEINVVSHVNNEKTVHCVRTVHAELNAIIQAAKHGIRIEGSKLFCTMFPCYTCAKAIINCGIVEVISLYDYQGSRRSQEVLTEAGVRFGILNEGQMLY